MPPPPAPRGSALMLAVAGIVALLVLAVGVLYAKRNDAPPSAPLVANPFDVAGNAILGSGPSGTELPAEAAAWPPFGGDVAVPPAWAPFTVPGTAITAAFPAPPAAVSQSAGASTRKGSYELSLSTQTLSLSWQQIPTPTGDTLEAQLTAAAGLLITSETGEPKSVLTPVRYRGLPALRVRLSEPSSNAFGIVVKKDDVFVAVSMSGKEIDMTGAGIFLNSLRIGS